MDDLSAMLSQFLGSEEGMNQVRAVADALGLGGTSEKGAPAGSTEAFASAPEASPAQDGAPPLDMGTLMLLQRAISTFSQSDKNTELLRALKPHFSEERAKKVDDAVRILQLIRLLPLVRESGLLNLKREGR